VRYYVKGLKEHPLSEKHTKELILKLQDNLNPELSAAFLVAVFNQTNRLKMYISPLATYPPKC